MLENFLEPSPQSENLFAPFLDSENTDPQDLGTFSAESNPDLIVISTDSDDEIILPPDSPGIIRQARSLTSEGEDELLGKAAVSVDTEDDILTGARQLRNGKNADPGSNKRKAFNIGNLTDNFEIKESVGKSDRKDFYKFKVKEETEVEIKLTGLTGNADLYLLPQRGRLIDKSKNGGKKDEEISQTLEPGTYYLRVQPRNRRIRNANYNLSLEIVESGLERFEFTYYYKGSQDKKNQDFYNGYVYAPQGTYEVGSYFDFNEEKNQAKANGKYYISSSSVAEEDAKEGEVYLESYYNVENDKSYTPYYASGGFASGTEGLGSEEDFIGTEFDSEEGGVALRSKAFFGADNYVADIVREARISKSGDYQIDALLSGLKWGTDQITYSFYDDSNGSQYYGAERNVGEVSEKVKQDVRHILENIYEPLLEVDFVEVADSSSSYGLIRVMKSSDPKYAYAYYPFADDSNMGTAEDLAGDVHLKVNYDGRGGTNNFQGGPRTHGYLSLIHELGHAVGLKHPHGGNDELPKAEDNTRNTVMSYNFRFKADTLMPYDVKALQFMYGAEEGISPDFASEIKYNSDGLPELSIRDKDGNLKEFVISKSRSVRGWSYEGGTVASYVTFNGNEAQVAVQEFTPETGFGPKISVQKISNSDSILGWDWNQEENIASYMQANSRGTFVEVRGFQGKKLGDVLGTFKLSNSQFDKNTSSWSWDSDTGIAEYTYRNDAGNIVFERRKFDSSSGFGELVDRNSNYPVDSVVATDSHVRQANSDPASEVRYNSDGLPELSIQDKDGNPKKFVISKSRSVRGWSYEGGTLASYVIFNGNEAQVVVQEFTPETGFGDKLNTLKISNSDSILGWDWNQEENIASYMQANASGTIAEVREFDGKKLGKVLSTFKLSNSQFDKNTSSWSWDSDTGIAEYTYRNGAGNMVWERRKFDSSSGFGELVDRNNYYPVASVVGKDSHIR